MSYDDLVKTTPNRPRTPLELRLEKRLGLPEGFIAHLENEDDWSFVIKSHALLEAAVSHLLAHTLGRPELIDVFSRLDMAAQKWGKLAFAKALDVIDDADRRFIRELGEIRNAFAHQISNAGATLSGYFEGLNADRRKSVIAGLNRFWDHVDDNAVASKLFLYSPKSTIVGSLGVVLVSLSIRTDVAERRSAWIAERAEFTAAYRDALLAMLSGENIAATDGPVEAKLVDDHEPS